MWQVPERYICKHGMSIESPCFQDKEVICWVARPREKTYLVRYMLLMQIVSIILTISELIVYTLKWSFRFHKPIEKRSAIVKDFNKVYLNSSSIRKNEYVKYRSQSQKGNGCRNTVQTRDPRSETGRL